MKSWFGVTFASSRQGWPNFARSKRQPTLTAAVLVAVILALAASRAVAAGHSLPAESAAEPMVSSAVHRRAVIILADGFTWEGCCAYGGPALIGLLSAASVGCANTRTADGGQSVLSACATLGAGRRMTAPDSAGYCLGLDESMLGETAADIYHRRTGEPPVHGQPPPPGGQAVGVGALPATAVVCIARPELERANAQSPYRGRPGLLGESLRRAGLFAAAIGNSDDRALICRPAVLVAMDSRAAVAWGDVGAATVLPDPGAPFGMASNIGAIAASVSSIASAIDSCALRAALAVVDMGDFARLARYAANLSPEAFDAQLRSCYSRLDALLAGLSQALGPPSRELAYVLVSPSSASGLAPVAIAGWSYETGLLTSPTTRRAGLVANLDLTPTILAGLGVAPAWECDGAAMLRAAGTPRRSGVVAPVGWTGLTTEQSWASMGHVAAAMRLEQTLVRAAQTRGPVIRVFIGLLVATVLGMLGVMALGRRAPKWAILLVRRLLVAAGAAPLLLLAGPMIGALGTAGSIALLLGGCATIAILLGRVSGSAMWSVALLSGATAAFIAADAFAGGWLASASLLGHSAVLGARYYGIGNELMGVLVGAAAVAGAAVSGRACVSGLAVGAAMAMLGHPRIGANFGGMISAAVAFLAIAAIGIARGSSSRNSNRARRWQCWHRSRPVALIGLALVVIGVCAALILLDAHSPEQASHIGRAWRSLTRRSDGSGQLTAIALRKLGMNIRLLRYTAWTQVLMAFLITLGAMAACSHGVFTRFRRDHFGLYAAFMGGLAGALAAMAANDSGVVACATLAMMPALATLGYAADELGAGRT